MKNLGRLDKIHLKLGNTLSNVLHFDGFIFFLDCNGKESFYGSAEKSFQGIDSSLY